MTSFRLIFISSLLCTTSASSHVSIAESPRPTDVQSEPRLEVSLIKGQIYQPEVYSKAISILTKMETEPSCHRVATLTLIESCQSLEQSPSSEVELSEVRSEYAIRLALCEITTAKVTTSSHCTDFLPATCSTRGFAGFFQRHKKMRETTNGKICYPEVTSKQVQLCLKDLSDSPQWWMSYSNNLQNVQVVCQASRNAIEQDEMLEQFKKAAAVGNGVTQTVAEALNQSKVFISSLQNLQAQVLRNWETETENSRSALGQLILNVQTAVHSMIESFRQDAEDASSHMDRLKQKIEKGHETTNDTSLALQLLYASAKTHFGDMSAAQRIAWEHVGLRADEIGNTLATVNAELPNILKVLQTILDHFQQSSQDLSTLHAELEANIEKNNNNLIIQEHIIKRIGIAGRFDIVQNIILAAAGIVILKSINSWTAMSVLAALILWLVYQAFLAIPFVHLAPIQPALPSYIQFVLDIRVKVIMLVAGVIAICGAVGLVARQCRQAQVSKDRKNTLLQIITGPRVLPPVPQPVAPSILVRDLKTVRPYRPRPQPRPRPRPDLGRARDIRAESAPP